MPLNDDELKRIRNEALRKKQQEELQKQQAYEAEKQARERPILEFTQLANLVKDLQFEFLDSIGVKAKVEMVRRSLFNGSGIIEPFDQPGTSVSTSTGYGAGNLGTGTYRYSSTEVAFCTGYRIRDTKAYIGFYNETVFRGSGNRPDGFNIAEFDGISVNSWYNYHFLAYFRFPGMSLSSFDLECVSRSYGLVNYLQEPKHYADLQVGLITQMFRSQRARQKAASLLDEIVRGIASEIS